MKIVIFGYGLGGVELYRKLVATDKFKIVGFADNSIYKQGKIVNGSSIMSMGDLIQLKDMIDFAVIIAAEKWFIIGEELEKAGIRIYGVYKDGEIIEYNRMSFERLDLSRKITLYAGDICDDVHLSNLDLYGLSINKADSRHIIHDITNRFPLPDHSIHSFQIEDVLEHIEIIKVPDCINEIYRILRKGSLLRISLPDYNSPYLNDISMKDKDGNVLFDPTGGGKYTEAGVSDGGHIWFPNYNLVKDLLDKTKFKNIQFLCYYTESGELIRKEIDMDKGYIIRMSRDVNMKKPIYSMVVDCYK